MSRIDEMLLWMPSSYDRYLPGRRTLRSATLLSAWRRLRPQKAPNKSEESSYPAIDNLKTADQALVSLRYWRGRDRMQALSLRSCRLTSLYCALLRVSTARQSWTHNHAGWKDFSSSSEPFSALQHIKRYMEGDTGRAHESVHTTEEHRKDIGGYADSRWTEVYEKAPR